jgi:ubiquinone/menaquinone biosynthesis C-methylase UbiE
MHGQRICDLACGEGRVARYLAGRGADVLGIDSLLSIAASRSSNDERVSAYLRDDAQRLDSVRDALFDGVVCHMALMDIPDLHSTLATVFRILQPHRVVRAVHPSPLLSHANLR